MAWTAPMTAVDNTPFFAAEFNTHVRDNLLETAPAKANTVGSFFVSVGANEIAERAPATDIVATSEGTPSTTFTDLATPGPSVTLETGTAALVIIGCSLGNDTTNVSTYMSFEAPGYAASGVLRTVGKTSQTAANMRLHASNYIWLDALTAGSNTFTAKYRVTGGVGTFANRTLTVIPL